MSYLDSFVESQISSSSPFSKKSSFIALLFNLFLLSSFKYGFSALVIGNSANLPALVRLFTLLKVLSLCKYLTKLKSAFSPLVLLFRKTISTSGFNFSYSYAHFSNNGIANLLLSMVITSFLSVVLIDSALTFVIVPAVIKRKTVN